MASPEQLLRWSEALAGIGRTGLAFTESLYERERFQEVLAVAADLMVAAGEEAAEDAAEEIVAGWLAAVGVGRAGYVTPKVAVGALVGDGDGRILLGQRADSGWWLWPTGYADIGYSPAEVAVKEVREETGIDCEVVRLVGVLDLMRRGMTGVPLYVVLFHCRMTGGTLSPHPLETAGLGFFGEDDLPEPLAIRPEWRAFAFAAVRGEPVEPLFDPARETVWRGDAHG